MLVDEAAEHMVQDYSTIATPRISGMSHIISMLCYLYPAVPTELVMREVVRNFSRISTEPLSRFGR